MTEWFPNWKIEGMMAKEEEEHWVPYSQPDGTQLYVYWVTPHRSHIQCNYWQDFGCSQVG